MHTEQTTKQPIPLFKVFMADHAAERVRLVLQSGYIGENGQVEQFEHALQQLLETPQPPITVNSCTSAIDLALHLIGVKAGDEVITTPVTCTATNSPIVTRGAIPVWADVDPYTGLIDPIDVGRKWTKRTKAIIAVDWGGATCDYRSLCAYDAPVIQDAAHHLSPPQGDYTVYSFQAIKFLTSGDGGALIAPADQVERARLLRWYGLDRKSKADFRCEQNIREVGYKYHMNDIAAAIGLANIGQVERLIRRHQANAAQYDGAFGRKWDDTSAAWLYTLLVENRALFIAYMADQGIACSPVHARNDTHAGFHYPNGPLPGVDHFASRNVAIPVGWWLSADDRRHITEAVIAWS